MVAVRRLGGGFRLQSGKELKLLGNQPKIYYTKLIEAIRNYAVVLGVRSLLVVVVSVDQLDAGCRTLRPIHCVKQIPITKQNQNKLINC